MDKLILDDLLKKAGEISKHAYAPYSKFNVGCAVLLDDGNIVLGVNIENASYPVSICAERTALANIVVRGAQHRIKALAVVTDASPPGTPCGMCRQFLSEFLAKDTPIIVGNHKGETLLRRMDELLPYAFSKDALNII